MTGHKITVVILAALFLMVGCREELSTEKADTVLKELALKLAGMEGSSPEARMGEVRGVCAKQGIEIKTLAAYLSEHPDSADKLAGYIADEFAKELADKRKEYQAKLDQIDIQATKDLASAKDKAEAERKALKAKRDKELEKLKKEFETRQAELEKAIAAVKSQQ